MHAETQDWSLQECIHLISLKMKFAYSYTKSIQFKDIGVSLLLIVGASFLSCLQ